MTNRQGSVKKVNRSGGAAGSGGTTFQAKIAAIVATHILTGSPLSWLDGLTDDRPKSVSAETGGPGDDIAIECQNGKIIEIQAKKGLRKTAKFWSAIEALIVGIGTNQIDFGLLAICPDSSGTLRKGFANALIRLADGRNDDQSPEQKELSERITKLGYNPKVIASSLRIRTVSALAANDDAIAAAKTNLSRVYELEDVPAAWNILLIDALRAIEFRGRRTIESLVNRLGASSIWPKLDQQSPAGLVAEMLATALEITSHFDILGMPSRLALDTAWIELNVTVRDALTIEDIDPKTVLSNYYSVDQQGGGGFSRGIPSSTVGQFRRHCVVVGGPGGGKSLLAKKLVRRFTKAGTPSLLVNLRSLASRIENQGCTVVEGLYELGLDNAAYGHKALSEARLSDLVILCDGLDETGQHQKPIAEGLKAYAQSNPSHRVIVTTRPVGYTSTVLADWRHYTLNAPVIDDLAKNVATLVTAVVHHDDDDLVRKITAYLGPKTVRETIARTPLLIGFVGSLFLKNKPASVSKADLYEQIFNMIDVDLKPRKTGADKVVTEIRSAVLDHLGWIAISNPTLSRKEMERECAKNIQMQMGVPQLQALETVAVASRYWEQAGMIEPLSSGSDTLLAFIHKSCAEYAAARHLATFDEDSCRTFITDNLDAPDWSEVLDFATRTGVAKTLAEVSMSTAAQTGATMSRVERGLYAVSKGLLNNREAHVASFIDSLVNQLTSNDRPRAFALGGLLLNHPIDTYPQFTVAAEALSVSTHRWQRLIGWSLRLKEGDAPIQAIRDAFSDLINDTNRPGYLIRPNDFFLGDRPDRDLLENFVACSLDTFAKALSRDEFGELLSEMHESGFSVTVRLAIKLEALLDRKKWSDLRSLLFGKHFSKLGMLTNFRSNDAGSIKFEQDMIIAPFVQGAIDTDNESVGDMLSISALLNACKVWEIQPYELRYWENAEGISHAQNAIRLAGKALGLSPETLGKDALSVEIVMNTDSDYSRSLRVFAALPMVDPPDFNWKRIEQNDVDLDEFKKGLHRGPYWLRILFAHMIDVMIGSTDERKNFVKQLLDTAHGVTFHLAAAFAGDLPEKCRNSLIINRLNKELTQGCNHLFEDLKKRHVKIDSQFKANCLNAGLLAQNVEVAEAAADWACEVLPSNAVEYVPVLKKAFDHWIQFEAPYPKEGGTVPTSPREKILELLHRLEPLSDMDLLVYLKDDRSDVRKVAETAFIDCLRDDKGVRGRLTTHLNTGALRPDFLFTLKQSDLELDAATLLSLIKYMVTGDPKQKRLAVRFLADEASHLPDANSLLRKMENDTDLDVREATNAVLQKRKSSKATALNIVMALVPKLFGKFLK